MPGHGAGQRDPYAKAMRFVMARAVDGVKESELPTPLHKAVAKRLTDQGRLHYHRLPSGDGIYSRK